MKGYSGKKQKKDLSYFLLKYLRLRPIFLSLIRAKEALLFQKHTDLVSSVLDYGCGDGFFASVISQYGSENKKIDIGLDIRESRIDEADKQDAYKKIVVYSGKKIPFPKNRFRTVMSNCVLEHIPDIERALCEINRVIKSNGHFIATVATKNWEDYLLGNLIFGDIYKKWMRRKQVHFNLFTYKEWKEVFKKNGFDVVKQIGYLDRKAVRIIDLLHYLSISSLIWYKLTGKWVIFSKKDFVFPLKYLTSIIDKDISVQEGANIFFILKKR